MKPSLFPVLLTMVMMALTSCGNRHITKNDTILEPDPKMAPGKVDMVQSLTEVDVKKSGSGIDANDKALAASSYLRVLPEKKDSVTVKAIDSKNMSKLIQKKTEELISNERSGGLQKDTIVRNIDFLKEFSVVAGSFTNLGNSLLQINSLKLLDYDPFVIKYDNGMFRVIAGTFKDKVDANIMSFRLENDSIPSWILRK